MNMAEAEGDRLHRQASFSGSRAVSLTSRYLDWSGCSNLAERRGSAQREALDGIMWEVGLGQIWLSVVAFFDRFPILRVHSPSESGTLSLIQDY